MEHEMTLFHAIEPIKKCFVPDTPFYDHIRVYWTLDGSAWCHNYQGYTTLLYLVMCLNAFLLQIVEPHFSTKHLPQIDMPSANQLDYDDSHRWFNLAEKNCYPLLAVIANSACPIIYPGIFPRCYFVHRHLQQCLIQLISFFNWGGKFGDNC